MDLVSPSRDIPNFIGIGVKTIGKSQLDHMQHLISGQIALNQKDCGESILLIR